jgi:septum formation protein
LKVVLCSTSPRRIELLSHLNLDLVIIKPSYDESTFLDFFCDPTNYALVQAYCKVESVLDDYPELEKEGAIFIGFDTVVSLNKKIYLKPKSREESFTMLKELSNNTHQVITGCYIYSPSLIKSLFVSSDVKIKDLSDLDIINYQNNFNLLDKAGSYGIQDDQIVESYLGDYDNILGCPSEIKHIISKIISNNIN